MGLQNASLKFGTRGNGVPTVMVRIERRRDGGEGLCHVFRAMPEPQDVASHVQHRQRLPGGRAVRGAVFVVSVARANERAGAMILDVRRALSSALR